MKINIWLHDLPFPCSDATEFLQIKDSLYGRLGELKEMEIDTRPHNKADIKFHGVKMLDGFQKFSNKMGEVWSSTAFIPNTKVILIFSVPLTEM